MPVFVPSSARPRQELSVAIKEGEAAIDGLIGEKILPPLPINRRTAHIIKLGLADSQGLRSIAANKYIHAPGTKFERVVAKIGDDSITVTLRGVEIVVPNETKLDEAGFLDVEAIFAARFGRETSGLTKESLISDAIFNTTTFGSATAPGTAWSTLATGSAIADIIASIRRVKAKGEVPDTVAMSGIAFEYVRQGTLVQNFVRGNTAPGAETNTNTLQKALADFGIKQVLVADSYVNIANDGATPLLNPLWSQALCWVGKAGMVGGGDATGMSVPQLAGVGANAFWEGYMPGGVPSTDKGTMAFEGGNYIESYPDLSIDSSVLRLKMSVQPYIGNSRCGDLISTGL